MDAAANIIETACLAMDRALRLPASIALEYAALRVETGLPRPTVEDLEGLFQAMAKAAHLYRLHDGPAPARDPDGWRRTAARCGAVCREASMQYHLLCIDKGQVIGGPVRERLNAWDYMAALFSSWPALSGCTGAAEPPSIAAEATSEPAEAATGAGIGKPLYSLQTSHNRQELARIYAALVDAGYIDGSAPDACGAFCRAFDPAADQQGRIAWAWTDKRTGRVSPRQILDFVAQMAGGLDGITHDMCDRIAPAIFGQAITRPVLSKFRTRWNRGEYCDTHAEIAAIVTGV